MKRDSKLILSLSSLIIFLFILIAVVIKTPLIDIFISQHIQNLWGSFNVFFIFIGNYSRDIIIAIALISAGILYIQKRKKASVILISSLLIGYLLEEAIKFAVQRARPTIQLVTETDYSFPSGHTIFSVILFSLLIYFYEDEIKTKIAKIIFIVINVILILFIGFSRIYINIHWFTDVIGGYAIGLFVVGLALFIFESKNKRKLNLL